MNVTDETVVLAMATINFLISNTEIFMSVLIDILQCSDGVH
jgi:hypothetical protein